MRLVLFTCLKDPRGRFFQHALVLVRKSTLRLALGNPPRTHPQGQSNGAPRFEMGERSS